MYHIKNDKRAQASTELICAGLLACMKEKPFARITITDVQRASTVSRSTFYRNFDCLEDVLALQPLADDPAQFDYFVAIITSTMVGILTVWVEHGKTETEEQMVQKLAGAFAEMAILELPG